MEIILLLETTVELQVPQALNVSLMLVKEQQFLPMTAPLLMLPILLDMEL